MIRWVVAAIVNWSPQAAYDSSIVNSAECDESMPSLRIFRNEGIDSSHSAEFTMLESYAAWGDQFTIAATTQRIIVDAADRALGTRVVPGHTGDVDLDGEWPWLSFYPGLSAALGEEITVETPIQRLKAIADARDIIYLSLIHI